MRCWSACLGSRKTLMISTLAQTLQMSFKRVQFTPDLMPSDITGTEVIYSDQATGEKQFKFLPGPLFANIVLADEINRTPPKTQAAMLEAMQERKVTVGGNTHTLPKPFFVLATQNPLEQEGTYPLPEAQLDRFMFLINVDYPTTEDELQIMRMGTGAPPEQPQPVLSIDQVLFIQETVKLIPVPEHVYRYAQRIVACTRAKQPNALDICKKYLSFGAGPRASLSLITAAKAHALIHGEVYLNCANVAAVAFAVMRHPHRGQLHGAERGHHHRRHRADDPGENPAGRASGLVTILARQWLTTPATTSWTLSRFRGGKTSASLPARSSRAIASVNTARPSRALPSSSPSTVEYTIGDDPPPPRLESPGAHRPLLHQAI